MTSVSPVRVLMMLVGEDEKSTAFDADEPRDLAASYFLFADNETEVVLASEHGGYPVIAGQMRRCSDNPAIARFLDDQNARSEIADTLSLSQIVIDDFDALVLFSSGIDVSRPVAGLIAQFGAAGKAVALSGPTAKLADAHNAKLIVREHGNPADWVKMVRDLTSATS